MNKLLTAIGVVFMVAIAIVVAVHLASEKKAVRIGVLSFLTGTYAQMGNDLANGILLASEVYRDESDEEKINVELKIEDGRGESKTSATAFARLQLWGMDAAIVAGDNQVPTVAPIIARDKIPTVTTIMSNSKALEYNSKDVWIFRDWISVTALSETMANYASEKLGLSKVALLKMRSEFGDEAEKSFVSTFAKRRGTVALVESFNELDTDAKPIILKAINSNADAIYVAGYGVCYGIVINQIRECGFKGPILTVDAVMNPETKSQIKDFHDIYFVRFVEPTDSGYESFKAKYKKRFAREASVYSAYGYDAFNILISGFKGEKTSANDIRDRIKGRAVYNTLLGQVSFKSNGDCSIPLVVQKMADNHVVDD